MALVFFLWLFSVHLQAAPTKQGNLTATTVHPTMATATDAGTMVRATPEGASPAARAENNAKIPESNDSGIFHSAFFFTRRIWARRSGSRPGA
jgi:hypothetical protein